MQTSRCTANEGKSIDLREAEEVTILNLTKTIHGETLLA